MDLKGDRILLRGIKESDLGFIYKLSIQFPVYQYEEDTSPTEEQVNNKYLNRIMKMSHDKGKYFALLITRSNGNKPLGEIHFHLDNEKTRCWELGYSLHPDYWGKGYATESVRLAIEHMFENLDAHKILGCCNGKNIRSAKCMERSGMVLEGRLRKARLLRGEWCDELVYSILEEDYSTIHK